MVLVAIYNYDVRAIMKETMLKIELNIQYVTETTTENTRRQKILYSGGLTESTFCGCSFF